MDKFFDMLPVLGILIIVFGSICSCIIACVVSINMRKTRVAEQIAVLKKEMIDKGFTAEEIIRVIAAGADPIPAPTPTHVATLTEMAIEYGYSTDEITQFAKALDAVPASAREQIDRPVAVMIEHEHPLDEIIEFVKSRTEAAKIVGKTPEIARVA